MGTTTTAADARPLPLPATGYVERLLTLAAERLQPMPAWDDRQRRLHWLIMRGDLRPYWVTGADLSAADAVAVAALDCLASRCDGPAWADTEASDAQRLARAIRDGRCTVL